MLGASCLPPRRRSRRAGKRSSPTGQAVLSQFVAAQAAADVMLRPSLHCLVTATPTAASTLPCVACTAYGCRRLSLSWPLVASATHYRAELALLESKKHAASESQN